MVLFIINKYADLKGCPCCTPEEQKNRKKKEKNITSN
jgi:hypothetical protein